MSALECEEFIKSSIALAVFRDSSSGGIIRLLTIKEEGIERKYVPFGEFKI